MIAEKILGNLADEKYKQFEICYVDIDWYNANKKIQMLVTRSGIEIGLRLKPEDASRGLSQDDVIAVIHDPNEKVIAVNIKESKCILVTCPDFSTMAKVCYEIGNRHAPLFYSGKNEIVTPYEKPVFEMLVKLHAEPCVKNMKIPLHKSISGGNYVSHSHDHTIN